MSARLTQDGPFITYDTPDISAEITQREYPCAEDIVSHIPIVVIGGLAYKMNCTNPLHGYSFVGFSASSGSVSHPVTIETEQIVLSGWGLIPDQTYLAGPNGTLITTCSIVGAFRRVVGFAQDANTMTIVKYYTPINII